MKPSLNEIVENLAYSFGEQHNMTLREALKHTVGVYREKLLREEDFRGGLNYNDFTQNVTLPLEGWSSILCGEGRITKDELPESIRFKNRGRVNYYFVGTNDFVIPFVQTTFAEYTYVKHLKHNTTRFYYVIEDNKLILLDNIKMCSIGVKGVFADPSLLIAICDNPEQINDDAPYPLGGDLLAIIRRGILNGDFPVRIEEEEAVITSNSDNKK